MLTHKQTEFIKVLRSLYRTDPFGVAGFAFWKIESQVAKAVVTQIDLPVEKSCLYAVLNGKLVFYWSQEEMPFQISAPELAAFKIIHLHGRYQALVDHLLETHFIHAYNPLSYNPKNSIQPVAIDGYQLITLTQQNTRDYKAIAEVIKASSGEDFTASAIAGLTRSPAYNPDLWVGVLDQKTNELVGVGISTYHQAVKETDLDWFYVRRINQDRGIGTLLVRETLSRCQGKSDVIRVAGVAEGFYRKCGFVPQDRWYYLVQKGSRAGWWD